MKKLALILLCITGFALFYALHCYLYDKKNRK